MSFRDEIPEELVSHTIAMCGDRGRQWLDRLPIVVHELEKEWSITVGSPFPAIEFNYVAEAVENNGCPAVVKISPPFDNNEIFSEASYLEALNGRGTVRLLARDLARRAILIERAVPGKNLAELFTGNEVDAIDPAITVLREITNEPPKDKTDTISLDDWFYGLRRYSEKDFPPHYAIAALEIYAQLANPDVKRYYLHGDFHPANIVSATRQPFLAIDPKGMIGPIGYDIAVFLNNFHWWQEVHPNVREGLDQAVSKFAVAFDFDAGDLRRWAFAQMVLSAWWIFDEMPEIYKNDVIKADIWGI